MKRIAFLFVLFFILVIQVFGQNVGGGFTYVGGDNLASASVTTMDFGGVTVTRFNFVPSSPILQNPAARWDIPLSSTFGVSKILLEGTSPTGSRVVKIAVATNNAQAVSTERISTSPGSAIGTLTFSMNPGTIAANTLSLYVAYEYSQQNPNATENTFLLKSITFQDASGNNTVVYTSPGAGGGTIPVTPTLGLPNEGATITLPYTFTWGSVADATSYTFQLDTDQSFTDPMSVNHVTTTTNYTVSSLSAGTYYWRVRANGTGGSSDFSNPRSVIVGSGITIPAVPALVSPANSATNQPTTLQLDWNDVTNATSYRVQVMLMNGTIVADQTITGSQYTANGLQNNTQYQWRVNATNSAGTSDWSSTWTFTTASGITIPAVPTLVSPANGVTNQPTTLSLDWNDVANATAYRVQVMLVNGTIVIDQSNLTVSGYEVLGLQNNTQYQWRVNASNSAGVSDWSATWTFTTTSGVQVPAVPALVSPANGVTNQPTTLQLDWNDVTNATSYRVQVMLMNGTIVVDWTNVTSSTFGIASLQNNTQYQWRVNATNSAGTSDWSSTWTFTTASGITIPAVPTLVSPANNSTGAELSQILDWNDVANATAYDVQIGTSSSFSNVVFSVNTQTSNAIAQNLQHMQTYYWRVRALNAAGNGEWSSVWNFMTSGITGIDEEDGIPTEYKLFQNYPNPFNPTTSIKYSVLSSTYVQITVYDMLGREVTTLVNEEKHPGTYTATFDASGLSSGIYLYRLTAGQYTETKSMILQK